VAIACNVGIGRRRHHERGAALVEFAVVSIVFFTFVFGITEFGRMVYDYNIVSTAVRDGARWAAVRGTASGHTATALQIKQYAVGRSLGRLTTDEISVTWPDSPAGVAKPGNRVVVAANHNFSSLTALVPFTAIPLQSTTSMVISR
jgi:Flp pilus assembly protein TadG